MLIPIVICILCLVAGTWATARWLPELALGPVGSIAFFAICGLVGVAVALVGLHIYSLVHDLETSDSLDGSFGRGELVAGELASMFWDVGTLVAAALVVFLLSPRPDTADSSPATAQTIDTPA